VYPTIETVEFKELDEGSAIDLYVKFNGNPLPKLEWKFGDKTISPSDRYYYIKKKALSGGVNIVIHFFFIKARICLDLC